MKVERGGAGVRFGAVGEADECVAIVFDGADGVVLGASDVPPFIAADAVSVGVGSGADGCVSGAVLVLA